MQKNIIFNKIVFVTLLSLFIFSIFSSMSTVFAKSSSENIFPEKPTKNIYVVDEANLINKNTKIDLLNQGSYMNKAFNTQIVVVTVNSLHGLSVEEYANTLFRKWGIGDKKENTGILILVAKKEHKARIEVGYGLEGIINDGKAGRILKTMLADFKKNKYDSGIKKAYGLLVDEVAEGKTISSSTEKQTNKNNNEKIFSYIIFTFIPCIAVFAFFICNFLEYKKKKERKQYELMHPDSKKQSSVLYNDMIHSNKKNNDDTIDTITTGIIVDNILHNHSSISSYNDDDDDDNKYSSWNDDNNDFFGDGDSGGGGASGDW